MNNLKKIWIENTNFRELLIVLAIEIGLGLLFIYFFYPVFSMLAFGEGANSFMYTTTNGVLMFLIPYLLTTIFNIIRLRIESYIKHNFRTAKVYSIVVVLLTIIYPIGGLWIWNFG